MTSHAPYLPTTRAKGWRLELDTERIRQSDTWALAPAEVRPWLLMLWMVAWEQTPCASLPDDDRLVAARIGMQMEAFMAAKEWLMRGWWLADDGRLYHHTLTEFVLDMLSRKDRERTRKANWREAKRGNVPRDNKGTDAGPTPDGHVSPMGGTTPEPEPVIKNTCAVEQHDDEPAGFAECWNAYPKREGGNSRKLAMNAYKAKVRQGVSPAELLAGTERYAAFVRAKGQESTSFVKQAVTFFGTGEHWNESWEVAGLGSGVAADNPCAGAI